MGTGCKLIQNAGLKEVSSTVCKENFPSKMFEGKAYSHCLGVCLLTDTDSYSLLSGNNHTQDNEENHIFEPIQTFDNNEDVLNFADDGNIFDCLDNNEQFFENIDFEDGSNISSVIIEKLKSNFDDNNGLVLLINCMTHLRNKNLVLMNYVIIQ